MKNLKAKYFLKTNWYFQNSRGAPPSEKLVTGPKYGLQNMVTGTEYGCQILVPEQNVSLKYWYQNKKCLSKMGSGTKTGLTRFLFWYQYLKATFCSGINIWETHSVPVTKFSRPYFVPVTIFSEGRGTLEILKKFFLKTKYIAFRFVTYLMLISDQNCSG